MRVIRYLFLLLSAVVMTGLFAGQAHAATVQKDNEISGSQTPNQTQSNKVEEVVTQSESTTIESTTQTKSVVGSVVGAETSSSVTTTNSTKSGQLVVEDQQINSKEIVTTGVKENETPPSMTAKNLPGSIATSSSRFAQHTTLESNGLIQTSQISSGTNIPTPTSPVHIPSSNDGLLLLAGMLKPIVTLSGATPYSPVQQQSGATVNLELALIAVGIVVVVGLLSASQMSMRKQGFNGAARGAGLQTNRLFSIYKRELLSDYSASGSLFSTFNFGFKTNMYLLKGGTI